MKINMKALIPILFSLVQVEPPASRGDSETIDEFQQFNKRLAPGRQFFVDSQRINREAPIETKRVEQAIQDSATWIKFILRPQFIPDNIESLIHPLPAGMDGIDHQRKTVRYDCTLAEFTKGGYHFLIIQQEGKIGAFVAPTEPSEPPSTPEEFVEYFREEFKEIFRLATATLYVRAIRLADFGVELIPTGEARYQSGNERRWKPTVLVPPKAYEDGAQTLSGSVNEERMVEKLKEIAPTMIEAHGFDTQCWNHAYAATDGRVLHFAAPKITGGQCGGTFIPDWFRIPEPGEVPDRGSKVKE